MGRVRIVGLSAAIVLLVTAAWLMSTDDKMSQKPDLDQVDFPAHMRAEEYERAEARKRDLPSPKLPVEEPPLDPEHITADPVLRALPDEAGSTVVVEANAIRHSPLGQLFVDCLRDDQHDPFEEIREKLGVDVLEDIDRIAVADETMLLSGHFGDAKWNELVNHNDGEQLGEDGTLYCDVHECLGVWGDELLIAGGNRDAVAGAIDRIEGRAEVSPPMAAKAQGEEELAELLGHTRISTAGGVSVELALPQALLQKHLEEVCRQHHEARRWNAAPHRLLAVGAAARSVTAPLRYEKTRTYLSVTWSRRGQAARNAASPC